MPGDVEALLERHRQPVERSARLALAPAGVGGVGVLESAVLEDLGEGVDASVGAADAVEVGEQDLA